MKLTRTTDTLQLQLRYTHAVVNTNLEGIAPELADRTPPGGGNSLNWVLGHLVHSRNGCLRMLGQEPVLPTGSLELYARGTTPGTGPGGALPLDDLRQAFNAAQEGLVAGIAALDEAALQAPAPFSPLDNPDETVGSLLAGLLFHESYHAGQLGTIRRSLGLDGAIA